jgi:sporulation protein YlmC with PRC-barrel domain
MKKILATTAIALIMAGGAMTPGVMAAQLNSYQSQPTDINASQFIGQRIYATDTMPATDTVAAGSEKDWDDVGEINEVILGRDGAVKAVVLGVGGFLGIGEKNVAIPMNDVKFVKNGTDIDDYFLVVNANKESLTAAPAYVTAEEKQAAAADTATPPATTADNTMADPAADPAMKPAGQTAAENAANTTDTTTTASTTNDARSLLTRPDVAREGYSSVQANELTADKLEGARVYGAKDEDVGEINRIILSEDGKKIDRVVLDVGGFLGIGEHQIAVTMDELNIVRNADGSDFRVYIDANQANLKAQPEFKG